MPFPPPPPPPDPAGPASAAVAPDAGPTRTPARRAPAQPRNPLHGITLEAMLTTLRDEYGWAGLDERIPLRCFAFEPSIKSSLTFLRRTPWAREKVEGLYLYLLRERQRQARG